MPTVSKFDTRQAQRWDEPQRHASAQINFPRPFVALPRIAHGICQLALDKRANIRVKSTIDNLSQTSATYHISSWGDTILNGGTTNSLNLAPANLEIQHGEHTLDLRGPTFKRIDFDRRFLSPPKVVVFFNLIDLDKMRNWRLRTCATAIDAKGFTLNIETWGDTILNAAQVGWVAYPEDRRHIFSASVRTQEAQPPNRLQINNSGAIEFGDVEFWKNPYVFMALNMFDLGCGHNFRLAAYADPITQRGLTWHLDSSSDSILYAAGASIIAVV